MDAPCRRADFAAGCRRPERTDCAAVGKGDRRVVRAGDRDATQVDQVGAALAQDAQGVDVQARIQLVQDGEAVLRPAEALNLLSLIRLGIDLGGFGVVGDVIGDAVFVGDTLFMPDYGTARCDFPKGSASILFDSIQSLYQLPEKTRVFLCHDYLPEKRDTYMCETDIQTQKNQNIHIHDGTTKDDFVEMRNKRDAGLSMPKLILPSIQINMKAGQFPEPEENGVSYLKLPLNYFK